jgi:hypothetical protein
MIFTNFPTWSKVPVERARARERKGAREKERESERERERERESRAREKKRARACERERDALSWRAVLHAGVHAPHDAPQLFPFLPPPAAGGWPKAFALKRGVASLQHMQPNLQHMQPNPNGASTGE